MNVVELHKPQALDFLQGGGKMGERMRAKDWSRSPLGPAIAWPQSLKTVIRIMLSSRYAMWMLWGPDLTFFCNDAYLPTLGVKQEWALGSRSDKVWEEIWPDVAPRIESVLKTGIATWDENLMLFLERSGYPEETYHTFSYSPLADDHGAVVGMLCVVTEETGKVIGERRLALLGSLAARLTGVLEEDKVFPLITDLCGNNRSTPFAAAFLASDDNPGAVVPAIAADDGALESAFARYLSAARLSPTDITVLDPPAALRARIPTGPWDRRANDIVAVPFFEAGSAQAAGYLVAGLNPYRRMDDADKGFLELLAGQIGSSLTNARAHQAERTRAAALSEIDRAKTVFFSNVSHEFRTPLTLMLTPLEEVLAKQRLNAEDAQLLTVAHRNSLRLLKLVNSLLDFSRIEAGRIQALYEPVDLAAITTDLASNFRSAVEKAGLTLTVQVRRTPGEVYVDRGMWEKVVLNLLSNAFKFTFAGGVTLTLDVSADGRSAVVAVADTGTGIPAAEVPTLFERFRRIEGAKSRSYEGSGIGLALVQELVKLHGGEIAVESEVDRGSTFTITLPLGTDHLPPERIGQRREDRHGVSRVQAYVDEAAGWLSGESEAVMHPTGDGSDVTATVSGAEENLVLLADDNADMRGYVGKLLKGAGFKVEAVADGEAALARARELKPDLILSDVMMPKLDGFGLLTAVRADAALRETPFLLLSARAGEEARVEGLQSGADDYLTKPFTGAALLARVGAQVKLSRMRKDNARRLKEEAETLETLNKVGNAIAAETDLERTVQVVTDAATQLSGAEFGAFFYNVINSSGESYTLYTLSGAPREAFSKFPQPRATAVFAPTFKGEGIVRSGDITKDPRFGKSDPYFGMPKGHLPVVSYLAVPVLTQSGEVAGGLFFGHSKTGVFDERAERIVAGIATQAGIAIDKARAFSRQKAAEERLQTINRVAQIITSDLDLERTVQSVTDIATELCGAKFGAFFYNVTDDAGDSYFLYSLSGAPKEAFSKFGMPRATAVFAPTFKGEGVVRSDDITKDPRYGKNDPHFGMPKGHLPVVSYLAVPVVSRTGEVIGGLFFGHDKPAMFTKEHEELVEGVAHHAAIALDNAKLMQGARRTADERRAADETATRLAAIVESSDDAIIGMALDGTVQSWNAGAQRIFGYTAAEMIGHSIIKLLPPDRLEEEPEIFEKIQSGGRVEHFETVRRAKDGRLLDVSLTVSPIKNGEGEVVGASKISRDITQQKRAQDNQAKEAHALALLHSASERLWESPGLAEGLNEILLAAIHMLGADKGNVQILDRAGGTLRIVAQSGFDPAFLEHFAEVRADDDSVCARALRAGQRVITPDLEADGDYESLRAVARLTGCRAVQSTPLIGSGGQLVGMLSTHFANPHTPDDNDLRRLDLYARQAAAFIDRWHTENERRKAEDERELLVAELSHRVKNTLATVISIGHQSFSKARTPEEGRISFEARILALSQTHARLAEGNWAGVSLTTLLQDEFRPYRNESGDNTRVAGPHIVLNSKAALTLGLGVHELATNSAKYGALSVRSGFVQVSWSVMGDDLRFEWRERGGPAVTPPSRRGFGRFLLERGIAIDLKGAVEMQFAPEGLTFLMTLPINRIRA